MTKAQQLKVLNQAMGVLSHSGNQHTQPISMAKDSATKTTDSGIDGNDNRGHHQERYPSDNLHLIFLYQHIVILL